MHMQNHHFTLHFRPINHQTPPITLSQNLPLKTTLI
jgi:hypothetical protein